MRSRDMVDFQKSNSYVYFALQGDDFDPEEISKALDINPSDSYRKNENGKYPSPPFRKHTLWKWSTEKGKEPILIDNLVTEVIDKFKGKEYIINELKAKFNLWSVLEIVLYIDINEEISTPALGHDLETIEFLYKTQTVTDVDIYRYNSLKEKNTKHF
ncbi:MAG: DUF4279 domain-containing protein [Sphingobacteriales bacterium]|nr:MAG: DUF4279 domain-containing protein [Sphingobacteriales bacterium]